MEIIALRNATMTARQRLSDATISTRVKAGRVQVVRVVFAQDGTSDVSPVSEYLPMAEAVAFLDSM